MKLVYQNSNRFEFPDFSFLEVSSTETWNFKIGPVNAKTGRRAIRPFTGLTATLNEPFTFVFEKLQAFFDGYNVIAYLEHEGHQYRLNKFTIDRTEDHSFMKAAYELIRTLNEPISPVYPAPEIAVETTVSYDVDRAEIERLRKVYPAMAIKSIDPKNRTITYILRKVSLEVQKPRPVAGYGIAS